MKHITKTQKIGAGAIFLLLLTIAGYVLFLRHIYVLQEELAEVKTKLAVVDSQKVHKLETEMLLSKTKDAREEIAKYFVSIEDPTPFLELIESVAKDAGVSLEVKSLSTDAQPQEAISDFHKEISVILLVDGSWDRIFHLISLLENMPYVATIADSTFSIDKASSYGGWKGQIELQCSAM